MVYCSVDGSPHFVDLTYIQAISDTTFPQIHALGYGMVEGVCVAGLLNDVQEILTVSFTSSHKAECPADLGGFGAYSM